MFLSIVWSSYHYKCSNSAGWSDSIKFKTPPAAGADEVKFLAYGDMGKAPRDPSLEHYIQVIKLTTTVQLNRNVYV